MPDGDVHGGQSASLGEQLRAARQAAGLSLEQVSARTRVRPHILADLEAGRFASSGGAVYARGHLRTVATLVGLDPAAVLAQFERESGTSAPEPLRVAEPQAAPARARRPVAAPHVRMRGRTGESPAPSSLRLPPPPRPEQRGPRWGALVSAAAVLLLVVLGVGMVAGGDPPSEGAAPPVAARSAPPAPSSASPRPPGPSAVAEVPETSGAALRVRAIGGSSWISVRGSDGVLFEGVLKNGKAKDFKDDERLRVVVGNAGFVSLVCGGEDAPEGTKGKVRRFTCDANDPAPA